MAGLASGLEVDTHLGLRRGGEACKIHACLWMLGFRGNRDARATESGTQAAPLKGDKTSGFEREGGVAWPRVIRVSVCEWAICRARVGGLRHPFGGADWIAVETRGIAEGGELAEF